ncbi:MAG: putative formin like protein [Streblomastix strix]|uniref:Putative formin like protein n=1 Tax=Streblomastix strix TaxID=222440 RepID=A0A5J4WVX6_9EUKA|nr:MAG: putative formin like protein [Streblomastix strix]
MTFWKPKTDNKAADKKADDPWDKMSDENIEKAYIKALQDLMFTQDQITKLTATQNRKNKITMIKQQLQKPRTQYAFVLISNIRSNPNKEHVRNLRVTLSTSNEKWFQEFFNNNGLQVIMELITKKYQNPTLTVDDMEIVGECIQCYKAIMNNQFGLQNVITFPGAVRCLFTTLQIPRNLKKADIETGQGRDLQSVYYENSSIVLELIANLCMTPQTIADNGLKHVMEAAESFRFQMNERVVLEMVLIQLRNRSAPELFLCRIIQLVNTILIQNDLLTQRLKLREQWDQEIQLNTMIKLCTSVDIGFKERDKLRNQEGMNTQSKHETPEELLNKHAWIYLDEMQQDNDEANGFAREQTVIDPERVFKLLVERFKGTKALMYLNNIGISLQKLKENSPEWIVIDRFTERTVKLEIGDIQINQDKSKDPLSPQKQLEQLRASLKRSSKSVVGNTPNRSSLIKLEALEQTDTKTKTPEKVSDADSDNKKKSQQTENKDSKKDSKENIPQQQDTKEETHKTDNSDQMTITELKQRIIDDAMEKERREQAEAHSQYLESQIKEYERVIDDVKDRLGDYYTDNKKEQVQQKEVKIQIFSVGDAVDKVLNELQTSQTEKEKIQEKLKELEKKLEKKNLNEQAASSSDVPQAPSLFASVPPAPSIPAAPSLGIQMPLSPNIPSAPDIPQAPSLESSIPSAPSIPPAPGIPAAPGIPSAPGIPPAPGIPSAPGVPSAPGIPGAPLAPVMPVGLPKKQPKKPKVPLKVLHWTKLPDRVITSTIWKEIDDANVDIDESELESLFDKKQTQQLSQTQNQSHSGLLNQTIEMNSTPTISLLDSKRQNNAGIMLSQFGSKTPEDIIQAIIGFDMSLLTPNRLQSLIAFLPSEEEKDTLLSFTGNPMNQTKAERFYLQLVKLNRVEERLKFLLFRSRSAEIAEYLLPAYKAVIYACAELKGKLDQVELDYSKGSIRKRNLSKNTPQKSNTRNKPMIILILESILAIGNYLNGESNQGCAYGCRLDVLSKICDFKGNDNKTTLLEYLVVKIGVNGQKKEIQQEKDQYKEFFTSQPTKSAQSSSEKLNIQTMDVQFITYAADKLNAEWSNVIKASKQSLPTLAQDANEINQGMLLVEKEIREAKKALNIRASSPSEDQQSQINHLRSPNKHGSTSPVITSSSETKSGNKMYLKLLESFYSSFQAQHEEIKICKEQCEKDVDGTIRTFNEDPTKISSEEFFTIFTNFLEKVNKVANDVKNRESNRRKDIERKKHEDQKKSEQQTNKSLLIQKSQGVGQASVAIKAMQGTQSTDNLLLLKDTQNDSSNSKSSLIREMQNKIILQQTSGLNRLSDSQSQSTLPAFRPRLPTKSANQSLRSPLFHSNEQNQGNQSQNDGKDNIMIDINTQIVQGNQLMRKRARKDE